MSIVQSFNVQCTDGSCSYERVLPGNKIPDLVTSLDATIPQPAMILIWRVGSEREIGIGLGREQTVITYQRSSEPPYFISQGEESDDEVEWFYFGDEQNEYLTSNLVPKSKMLPVLGSFLRTEDDPDEIDWETL